MAKAWVQDLWVKDHIVRDDHGKIAQRLKPTSRELQAIGKLPEQYRSANYGKGSRWRVNWLEEANGKPVRKAEGFATKTLAEQRVTELNGTLNAGTHITKDLRKQVVSAVAEMWLKSKQKIRASTRYRYRNELDRYVLPKWGTRTLDSISQTEVELWVAELQEGIAPHKFVAERKQAKLQASAIEHIVSAVFGSVLKYAVTKGWLLKSPVVGVELPRPAEKEVDGQVLTPLELQALIAAADAVSPQDGRMIRVLGFTGLRIGELFALTIGDWDGRTLTVRHTLTQRREGIEIGPPKPGRTRKFPVATIAADALNAQVEGQGREAFIFRDSRGGRVNPHNWRSRVWNKAIANAGLDINGLTPHSLRHTAASLAISAGASVMIIQRMLGHKTPTVTLNTYLHLFPSDLDVIGDLIQAHYERGLESD